MSNKDSTPTIEQVLAFRHSITPPFSVIPLHVDSKLPAVRWKVVIDGQPFTDDELRAFWRDFRGALNPGVACGRYGAGAIVVVDLDGQEAVAWARANLPPTPVVTVTRSGEHWYYRHPSPDGDAVGNRADVLAAKSRWRWEAKEKHGLDVLPAQTKGQDSDALAAERERAETAAARAAELVELGPVIDVRGDGGQVVAPGAIHPSGFVYDYKDGRAWTDADMAAMPVYDGDAWFSAARWRRPVAIGGGGGGPVAKGDLRARVRARSAAAREARSRRGPVTYARRLERAGKWLCHVDAAIAGSGGHNKTFYAACRLVCGFLLEPDDAFEMLKADYNPRCQPPWTVEELAHKVTEAMAQRGQNDGFMYADDESWLAEHGTKKKVYPVGDHRPDDSEFMRIQQPARDPGELDVEELGGGGAPPPQSSPPPPPRQPPPPSGGGGGGGGPPKAPTPAPAPAPSSKPLTQDEREWQDLLKGVGVDYVADVRGRTMFTRKRVKGGGWSLPPDTNNLSLILQFSSKFRYDIRRNELKLQSELNNERVDDHVALIIKANLDHMFQRDIALERVRNAIEGAAAANRHEPVQDWLESLPPWDGVDRIAMVPEELLGMTDVEDVHRTMMRHFLTGLVARIMVPGTKVDTIMFLVGGQGAGKSQFFRMLMDGHLRGDQWFTDAPISLRDKDGRMLIGTNVLVEWSEGEHAKSAKMIDSVKQFLSQQEDEFRPPYGRYMIKRPRRCVFCGTSNDIELLHDNTGSRRFYVLRTGADIDLKRVVAWREQLFAQALGLYRRWRAADADSADWHATRWWFTAAEDGEREAVVSQFRAESVWHEDIAAWLESLRRDKGDGALFLIGDVAEHAVQLPRERKSKRAMAEIRASLLALGARELGRVRRHGVRALWWSLPPKPKSVDEK